MTTTNNHSTLALTLLILVLLALGVAYLPRAIDALNERLINSVVTTRKVTL